MGNSPHFSRNKHTRLSAQLRKRQDWPTTEALETENVNGEASTTQDARFRYDEKADASYFEFRGARGICPGPACGKLSQSRILGVFGGAQNWVGNYIVGT